MQPERLSPSLRGHRAVFGRMLLHRLRVLPSVGCLRARLLAVGVSLRTRLRVVRLRLRLLPRVCSLRLRLLAVCLGLGLRIRSLRLRLLHGVRLLRRRLLHVRVACLHRLPLALPPPLLPRRRLRVSLLTLRSAALAPRVCSCHCLLRRLHRRSSRLLLAGRHWLRAVQRIQQLHLPIRKVKAEQCQVLFKPIDLGGARHHRLEGMVGVSVWWVWWVGGVPGGARRNGEWPDALQKRKSG